METRPIDYATPETENKSGSWRYVWLLPCISGLMLLMAIFGAMTAERANDLYAAIMWAGLGSGLMCCLTGVVVSIVGGVQKQLSRRQVALGIILSLGMPVAAVCLFRILVIFHPLG